MRTNIAGTVLPVLHVELAPGETLVAETGQLSWMTGNIALNTTTQAAGAGGFLGAMTRALGGGGLFMTEFTTSDGRPGDLAFAAHIPGRILELELTAGGPAYLLHRHGFLCATPGVILGAAFQRSLGAGIFGGDGFRLQRLSGQCRAFVELGGEIVERTLAPGETLLVHPGHVGMFEETVNFDITMIRGIRNALFGGDGLFFARLTGPGRIWLQTLTLPTLAHALEPYLPTGDAAGNIEAGAGAGVAGSLIRNFLSRN